MTPSTLKPSLARCAAIAAFSLLLTPALTAQNSGRGFVKAQAGSTLFRSESNLTASGGFGVRITDYFDLFAEAEPCATYATSVSSAPASQCR